jgi:hypothetical protein
VSPKPQSMKGRVWCLIHTGEIIRNHFRVCTTTPPRLLFETGRCINELNHGDRRFKARTGLDVRNAARLTTETKTIHTMTKTRLTRVGNENSAKIPSIHYI